jgi:hypothetical protein
MIDTPPTAPAAGLPRMNKGQATLLRAFALWTVWVWGTRIWNIWGDDTRSAGFKVVHTVLAVVSVAFAAGAWWVVHKLRTPAPTVAGDPVRSSSAS